MKRQWRWRRVRNFRSVCCCARTGWRVVCRICRVGNRNSTEIRKNDRYYDYENGVIEAAFGRGRPNGKKPDKAKRFADYDPTDSRLSGWEGAEIRGMFVTGLVNAGRVLTRAVAGAGAGARQQGA